MKLTKTISAVCAMAVGLTSMSLGVFAAVPDGMEEQVIFSGSQSQSKLYNVITQTNTTNASGKFVPDDITEGGYFKVDYTGGSGDVSLVLSEWTNGTWGEVKPDSTEKNADGSYESKYTYASVVKSYGSSDFEGVDAICTQKTGGSSDAKTTVTSVSWVGKAVKDDLGADATMFRGSATATAQAQNLTFFYTKHVGGDWDASQITKDSYIYCEYKGPTKAENAMYIALSSSSGAVGPTASTDTHWVACYPDETGTAANGNYYAKFKYDNFSAKFGTNFQRLDQIQVYSDTNEAITLKKVAYFKGTGEAVDKNGDDTWVRNSGDIAFIGDSICENARLLYKDWNTILDRNDCVNYGIGGQTTVECVNRISELCKKGYKKFVIICGINDIGHGVTDEQVVANDEAMIAAMKKANPDMQAYVVSVLPTTKAFYVGQQDRITGLDTKLKAMTEKYDYVSYVNCFDSFEGTDGYAKAELLKDGLHPNTDGYALIKSILNPYLDGKVSTTVSISNATVSGLSSKTYTGSAIKPAVTVNVNGKTLTNNTDYTVKYSSNTNAGTAKVTIAGKGIYTGTVTKTFTIKKASAVKASVTGISSKTYTGKAIKPSVTVKLGKKTLKKNTDYTVSYGKNTSVGKATVTITFKGNYSGTIKKTFKINPKGTSVKSLTSKTTKTFKVGYSKVSGVTGYEIRYSTSSKYTKAKYAVVSSKTLSKTISKLTKGKKYYVSVRSYKTVSKVKYTSSWSKTKTIKVK